ncbi:coiled-coil domain-containing protein 77-like isoform X2 [Lycorma delicatula]
MNLHVKGNNSQMCQKLDSVTTFGTSAEEQIRLMKPSSELIAYYRKKVEDLNESHLQLEEQFEMCKKICQTNFYAQEELIRRNDEVTQLKKAISDLQVYLYQEREHVLQLSAENDKYRLSQLEYKKKLDTVLSFAGLPKDFITFICFNPNQDYVIPRKEILSRVVSKNTLKNSQKDLLKDIADGQVEIENLKIQALMAEWEEQSELYRDEIQSLLSDRDLREKEWNSEQERLQQQINNLNNMLKSIQSNVYDDSHRLIKMEKRHRIKESAWLDEKSCLLKSLEASHEAFHSSPRNSRFLKCQLTCLKRQLIEKDGIISKYQDQNASLEVEVEKIKEEMEINKFRNREKCLKLMNQIKFFKQKFDDEKRRRLLDGEGFRNDIKFLRERVQTLEKKVLSTVIPSLE